MVVLPNPLRAKVRLVMNLIEKNDLKLNPLAYISIVKLK
jgi:hypothetical protein